jgi:hypothetical protein
MRSFGIQLCGNAKSFHHTGVYDNKILQRMLHFSDEIEGLGGKADILDGLRRCSLLDHHRCRHHLHKLQFPKLETG